MPITSGQAHKMRKQVKKIEAGKRLAKLFPGAKKDGVDFTMLVE